MSGTFYEISWSLLPIECVLLGTAVPGANKHLLDRSEITGQHLIPTGSLVVDPLFDTTDRGCSALVVPQGQGMYLTYGHLLGFHCNDAMQF